MFFEKDHTVSIQRDSVHTFLWTKRHSDNEVMIFPLYVHVKNEA